MVHGIPRTTLHWDRTASANKDGVVLNQFTFISAGDEVVAGLVWRGHRASGPLPVVLLAHGRGTGSSDFYIDATARRLVLSHGWIAVALDAPGHGARRPTSLSDDEASPKPDFAQSGEEWRTCIDALAAEELIDVAAIGFWGFSMGTATGISLIASEPRICCAALGLMHARYYDGILGDAANINCPLLFTLHWDDRRMPREEGFKLFDAFASPDKRLHAYPGDHADFTPEETRAVDTFLAEQLAVARDPARR